MGRLLTHKQSFLTAGDLYERAKETGITWLDADLPLATKVIRGSNDHVQLSDGLSVHYSDARELDDLSIETDSSAHIGVRIFLEGAIEATIGGQLIPTSQKSSENGNWQPVASVFSQVKQERFYRKVCKGERVRKVIITMSHDWLKQHDLGDEREVDLIKRFTNCHLACKS